MKLTRRALVVEDRCDLWREAIERLFPKPDWDPTFVPGVERARQEFDSRTDFDLLLVDHDLEDGTGSDFIRFARSVDDNIPIFQLSGVPGGGFLGTEVSQFKLQRLFVEKDRLTQNPDQMRQNLHAAYSSYMAEMCTPRIHSEYGQLRSVLVHRPWVEMKYLDPQNLSWYLLDSLPDLSDMQQEHDIFVDVLKRCSMRPLVLDIGLLLHDVVRAASGTERRSIVEAILLGRDVLQFKQHFASCGLQASPRLDDMLDEVAGGDADAIVNNLLSGVNMAAFLPAEKRSTGMWTRKDRQIALPTVNLYFMRDPGFVLGDRIFISSMSRAVRRREPSILRTVIQQHPFMKHARQFCTDLEECSGGTFTVEGGDAMAIGEGDYAIAVSERTGRAAVREVATALLNSGTAQRVFQPTIPERRAFMHLDTVCSVVGDHTVVYPDAVEAYADTLMWDSSCLREDAEPRSLKMNFIDVLTQMFQKGQLLTADGGIEGRHEQFNDATNMFVASPQHPVAYASNRLTNQLLNERGYKVQSFAGPNLVVGRGGPRCMTMPLRRD